MAQGRQVEQIFTCLFTPLEDQPAEETANSTLNTFEITCKNKLIFLPDGAIQKAHRREIPAVDGGMLQISFTEPKITLLGSQDESFVLMSNSGTFKKTTGVRNIGFFHIIKWTNKTMKDSWTLRDMYDFTMSISVAEAVLNTNGDYGQLNCKLKWLTDIDLAFCSNLPSNAQLNLTLHTKLIIKPTGRFAWKGNDSKETLAKSMRALHNTMDFSDIVIACGDEKAINCHKAVLGARSPVFQRMFANDTQEASLNRIKIDDFSIQAIQHFIKFLYTDNFESGFNEHAEELLRAADKYAIPRLKGIASSCLTKQMDASNVLNLLVLADMTEAQELKTKTMDCIVENSQDMMKSQEWMEFLKERLNLANEVIRHIAKELNESRIKMRRLDVEMGPL